MERYKSRKFIKFLIGMIVGIVLSFFDMLGMPVGYFIISMVTGYSTLNVFQKTFTDNKGDNNEEIKI